MRVTGVGAAHGRAWRTGLPFKIASKEEAVPLPKTWVVCAGSQHQRRARRPASDALRREPDDARGIRLTGARGFARHELPEPGHILLELSIGDVGAIPSQITQLLGRVIRIGQPREESTPIQLAWNHWSWRDQSVVIPVPQDDVTGRYAPFVQAVNLGLPDPI